MKSIRSGTASLPGSFDAFVLAGGQSSRMGRDKALLEVDGRPLIALAVDRLRALSLEPRICGARPDLACFAPVVPDNFPGCGPLGGLEAALAVCRAEYSLFLPVDLPALPVDFLRWLLARAAAGDALAIIPECGGRPQPLCAVYHRKLQPGFRAALASGSYRVMAAAASSAASLGEPLDRFRVESVCAAIAPGTLPASPPPHRWFRNVNTPADYRLLCAAGAPGINPVHPIS